jgi:hypothetical protein
MLFFSFKNGFLKLIKNLNLLSNKGSKLIFTKLSVYFYTMIQLLIDCILMDLIFYFMFEAQTNYMWFLLNFKLSAIYI